MNDDKHVDWAGLKYYDSLIKQYVDEVAAKVKQESVSDKELADLTRRLNIVSTLATANKENIEELFNRDAERLANINKLLDSDKAQAEDIRELQTRVTSLATKQDFEQIDGKINLTIDNIAKLESAVQKDHVTLENLLVALNDKASKQYVDEAISNIPQTNLEQYATKDYVLEKINDAALNGNVDLSNYYNKETVDAKFSDTDTKIVNNSARIDELVRFNVNQNKNFDELKTSLATDYYTKSEVDSKISEAVGSIDIPEVDLSDYYTKDEVDKLIPDDFATKSDIDILNDAVASVQESLDEKADKTQLVGLATEEFVKTKIAEAELNDKDVDLSQYYTKTEVDEKIPDVSNFATKQELEDAINNIEHPTVDLTGYATEKYVDDAIAAIPEPDLSEYAKKTDIPSIEGLATEKFVTDKIAEIVIPEVPTKVSELDNDAGYITANDIPETDLSDYYNKSETENLIAEAVKDIEHPTVDLTGYATEDWVNQQGFAKTSDIPDTSVFVTNERFDSTVTNIEEHISNVEENYTTLEETVQNISSTYVTNETLVNNYTTTEQLASTYVTQTTLEENYITNEEATTKIEQVVEEKVQEAVTPESIKYDTWE